MATVREEIETAVAWCDPLDVCLALGIDPDMDFDTLRRRLQWGERVEQCESDGNVPYNYPGGYHSWLTRPDNTDGQRKVQTDGEVG